MKRIIFSSFILSLSIHGYTQHIGIGNTNPAYPLDISGRLRIRGGAGIDNSAGVYLGGTGIESTLNKAFMGIASDTSIGFYGYPGAGWSLTMDIRNGNTGIGQGAPLNLSGLTVNKKVGAVAAMFGSDVSGVAIETDYPGIGFNTYYNGTRKVITSGYGGYIGADPLVGGLRFYVTDDSYTPGITATMNNAIAIVPNGNTGIGVNDPGYKLDVGGRMRLRSVTGSSAGLWLNNDANNATPAFIGMRDDSLLGFYGAGSNWSFRMNTQTGNIGIGNVNPNAPLQFDNTGRNRKIVLYESANNDNQFYGFGINASSLRYQTASTGDDHVFYAGAGTGSSNELMRVKGNGYVGIGVPDPVFRLDVKDRMRIRSGGDNNTSAGIYFNNNANNLAAFVGMQTDNLVGFWGSGTQWGLTMNTQTGALNVGNSPGTSGQVLMSNGSGSSPGWTSAGNVIRTEFAGLMSTTYRITGSDFIELTNSAYTVTLSVPSRVMLFCKSRTYATYATIPGPVDYESRWRLEVWLNGAASRAYSLEGRTRLLVGSGGLDLTTGPEFFDLPAGTHHFTFFALNEFGTSYVSMQAVAMIIPQ